MNKGKAEMTWKIANNLQAASYELDQAGQSELADQVRSIARRAKFAVVDYLPSTTVVIGSSTINI